MRWRFPSILTRGPAARGLLSQAVGAAVGWPPKMPGSRPNNLPAQTTLLIGRAREIETAIGCLHRSDARLVTLTGVGGTGKTRLALQVAAELCADAVEGDDGRAAAFTDGVFLVQLSAIRDPALVPSA